MFFKGLGFFGAILGFFKKNFYIATTNGFLAGCTIIRLKKSALRAKLKKKVEYTVFYPWQTRTSDETVTKLNLRCAAVSIK